MRPRLIFYCQPVLGLGHLVRSLALLHGLPEFEIWFVNGGRPLTDELRQMAPANVRVVDLPALEADPNFHELLVAPAAGPPVAAPAGPEQPSIEMVWERRREILLELLERVAPEILLIELYPFGRLKFDAELRPLLEAAQTRSPAPRIVCSLRDILVAKRDQPGFEQFAIATANRFFDLILIHSDPRFQRLDETFQPLGQLTCRVEYTGYVTRPLGPGEQARPGGEPGIIASIGGGRVGVELLWSTIRASRLLQPTLPHHLKIFTGPYLPETDLQELSAECGRDRQIEVQRFTPDLALEMSRASLSISLAGYNTCMDIIIAGVPAIVLPFTGNNNLEQTQRARKLAALGLVRIISPDELNAVRLAELMERALSRPQTRSSPGLDLGGVEKTARILGALASGEW
jgi:predicted glycosyltransferase